MPVLLFLGDIVGQETVDLISLRMESIRSEIGVDWVVANAENAANGSGLTPAQFRKLRDAGIDGITLGDHALRKREISKTLDHETSICRPANFPLDAPGRGWGIAKSPFGEILHFTTVLGRTFMKPVDCPFRALDRILAQAVQNPWLVDIHAEATGEKVLLGQWLDGRVGAALGTHTHIATADEVILPKGTAYLTDVGMSGPSQGVLGRKFESILSTVLTGVQHPFEVARGNIVLCGALIELNRNSGLADSIKRIRIPLG